MARWTKNIAYMTATHREKDATRAGTPSDPRWRTDHRGQGGTERSIARHETDDDNDEEDRDSNKCGVHRHIPYSNSQKISS